MARILVIILVIEDEKDLHGVLEHNLRRTGHAVVAAFTGEEGLRLARESPPDSAAMSARPAG